MIIRAEELKEISKKILAAVDSHELSAVTETLEILVDNRVFSLSVTNREYFAKVKLNIDEDIKLHATVNANLFLSLISQITTDTIELYVQETSLVVKGNGTYKLPLIFDNDTLLTLPEIRINNKTVSFDIDSAILLSILNYNSKELEKGTIAKPAQRYYYVDEQGAITFVSGACVNTFTLEQPVRMLLNNRLVKLFKLFKTGKVHFTLGYDAISDDIIQTKVCFESSDVALTAILSCDDALIDTVPVTAIRNMATKSFAYSVSLNRDSLLQTINRLLLFSSGLLGKEDIKPYSTFVFGSDSVTVFDVNNDNKEVINYNGNTNLTEEYEAILDLQDLKKTLESYDNDYINIHFGDSQAIVLTRPHIYTVIPEIHSR